MAWHIAHAHTWSLNYCKLSPQCKKKKNMAAELQKCSPLPLGGHDCEFVDSPPESWECPVCLLVLREPHLLSCCGVKICQSCISGVRLCVCIYIHMILLYTSTG